MGVTEILTAVMISTSPEGGSLSTVDRQVLKQLSSTWAKVEQAGGESCDFLAAGGKVKVSLSKTSEGDYRVQRILGNTSEQNLEVKVSGEFQCTMNLMGTGEQTCAASVSVSWRNIQRALDECIPSRLEASVNEEATKK